MSKVKIKIDNKIIYENENCTILEAATNAKIHIPTLCYLEKINNISSCKLCVVEIKGYSGLVTSCNTKIKSGMEINTKSERVKNARKEMLSLILSNHNFNCAKCKNNKDCELQNLANEFNIKKTNYEQKFLNLKKVDKNPFLEYDPKICIGCKRCVAACKKFARNGILQAKKIGNHTFINTPFGQY